MIDDTCECHDKFYQYGNACVRAGIHYTATCLGVLHSLAKKLFVGLCVADCRLLLVWGQAGNVPVVKHFLNNGGFSTLACQKLKNEGRPQYDKSAVVHGFGSAVVDFHGARYFVSLM